MIRIIFNIFVILSICGCSATRYANNRPNANWQLESSQCQAYANGNIPNHPTIPYDNGAVVTGSGVIGSTPYFYSGTIAPDHAYNMQAGLNNAANAFSAIGARQNLYEQCLRNLGWYEVSSNNTASRPIVENYVPNPNPKSEVEIKNELNDMATNLVKKSANTIEPNINNKELVKDGNKWIARYISIDPNKFNIEMKPGNNGRYVGIVRYEMHFMQCIGKTQSEALSAPCSEIGTRRMNELIAYDGYSWKE